MSINEILLALLTGIISAVFYSIIQSVYIYFKWLKTKRFFIRKIKNKMISISYDLMTVLDVNPIYETEFESDHFMEDDEFISVIEEENITNLQWYRINKLIEQTLSLITETRKEGFLIPTYTPTDFHAVDSFVNEMNSFISSYSWVKEELGDFDISKSLKTKLVSIVKLSKQDQFPNKFLDRIYNKYKIKVFGYKKRKNNSENIKSTF